MAGVKISDLPAIVTPNVTDVFPVVQAGVTYKETVTQLGTLMLLLSGGTMTGNLTLVGDPTTNLMAATKQYVDTVATGLNVQASCRVATTAALTVTYSNGVSGVGATLTNAGAMAAINIDGVALSVNDRVLVKDQASTFQNGIYTVTTVGSGAVNWVMTRATDFDTPAEIQPGDFIIVVAGTVNASSSWVETATVVTIGTDPITFSSFSASLPLTVPNGGTGRTTSTTAYGLLAAGTTATGAHQTLATGSSGQVLQSGGAAALPTYSTATYPNVATGTGTILRANGTNWVASTATYPDVATSTGSFLYANGTNWVASTSLWPNTVGSAGTILRSNGTANAYTTSTFADTYAVSTILYASSANVVTGLATAASSILVTSAGSVPSWSTTLPSFTTNTITFSPTTAGIVGTTTNDDTAAGNVGEYVESVIAAASAVTFTNGVVRDLTSISLTAGDWDVWGNISFPTVGATAPQQLFAWISSTSATIVDASLYSGIALTAAGGVLAGGTGVNAPQRRFSLSATTTIYISGFHASTSGNATGCGRICARRVR